MTVHVHSTAKLLFVPGLGTDTGTVLCSCGDVSGCAGSRNLDPNVCLRWDLNRRPGRLTLALRIKHFKNADFYYLNTNVRDVKERIY